MKPFVVARTFLKLAIFACALALCGCQSIRMVTHGDRFPPPTHAQVVTILEDGGRFGTYDEEFEIDDSGIAADGVTRRILERLRYVVRDRMGEHLNALAARNSVACDDPPAADCRKFVLGRATVVSVGDAIGLGDDSYRVPVTMRASVSTPFARGVADAGMMRCRDSHDVSRPWRGPVDYDAKADFSIEDAGLSKQVSTDPFVQLDYLCPNPVGHDLPETPYHTVLYVSRPR